MSANQEKYTRAAFTVNNVQKKNVCSINSLAMTTYNFLDGASDKHSCTLPGSLPGGGASM